MDTNATESSLPIKEWEGWWLPEHETHLIEWMTKVNRIVDGRPSYQYHKLERVMKLLGERRVAVDIGAHCGLWSRHLVKDFQFVWAFEPLELHRICFARNLEGETNFNLIPCALGEKEGMVGMHTSEGSSGDSWVEGSGNILLKKLDDFNIENVDLIKVDCEGYELYALRGAAETLKRCRPVVIVEQKPGRAQKWGLGETDAVTYLSSLGARLIDVISGDFIMCWS